LYSDGIDVAVGSGASDGSVVNPVCVSPDGIGVAVGTFVLLIMSLLCVVGCKVPVGDVDAVGTDVLVSGLDAPNSVGVADGTTETPSLSSTAVGHDVTVGTGDMDGPPGVLPLSFREGFGDAVVSTGDNDGETVGA
jgi:hypothetical protein